MSLRVVPLTLAQANALVAALHRHHKPVVGHRFSVGCDLDGKLVGAAIVGRPVAGKGDTHARQYVIASVTRLVTDGTRNACSFLYAAAARAARELGYAEIETFTLARVCPDCGTPVAAPDAEGFSECLKCGTSVRPIGESGISLRAAGWEPVSVTPAGSGHGWDSRRGQLDLDGHVRRVDQPREAKARWVKRLR